MKRAYILTLALISLTGNMNAKEKTDNLLETTKIFKKNHNFAYQGNFPKIDGKLLPDWTVAKDVKYKLNKLKNEKSSLYGWESNSINFKNINNSKNHSIKTVIPVDLTSNIAISFEAKLIKPKSKISGLIAELKLLDKNNKETLHKTFKILGNNTDWITYNYISDVNVPEGTLNVSFKIQGKSEVELKNLYVTEVENWEKVLSKTKIKPKTEVKSKTETKKIKKPSGPRTLFNIMKEEKFVEMIWKARRPNTKNEKEFYIHYLQGALKLSDKETSKRYREKHTSTSKLEKLTNKARKKLELPPVSFDRPLFF